MAVSAAAQLLDELMGRNRNLAPSEKGREIRWDDSEVCKYFLCGFCPHELFTNTRADLGPCDKVHDDELRKSYQKSTRFQRVGYEEDFFRFLQSLLSDVERRIKRGHARLALNSGMMGGPNPVTANKEEEIEILTKRINDLVQEAEELGCEGKVEEAQGVMRLCEQLKEEREQLELRLARTAAATSKEMEVCPICGAFLVVGDAQQRHEEHLTGRQHMGYAKVRSTVEMLESDRQGGLDDPYAKRMDVCATCGALLVADDAQQRIDEHLMGKQHMGYARIRDFVEQREKKQLGEEMEREEKLLKESEEREKEREKEREERRKREEAREKEREERRKREREREEKKRRSRSHSRSRRSRSRSRSHRGKRSRSRDRDRRKQSSRSRDRSRDRKRRRSRSRSRDRSKRSSRERSRRSRSRSRDRRTSKDHDRKSRDKDRDKRRSRDRDDRRSKDRDDKRSSDKDHRSRDSDRDRDRDRDRDHDRNHDHDRHRSRDKESSGDKGHHSRDKDRGSHESETTQEKSLTEAPHLTAEKYSETSHSSYQQERIVRDYGHGESKDSSRLHEEEIHTRHNTDYRESDSINYSSHEEHMTNNGYPPSDAQDMQWASDSNADDNVQGSSARNQSNYPSLYEGEDGVMQTQGDSN